MRGWGLRQIYLYLVSFVALMLVITGMIRTLMAVGDVLLPRTYYMAGPVDVYQRYKGPDGASTVPKEIIDEQIEFEKRRERDNARISAYHDLKRGFAYVIVAAPLWLYHWRRIQIEAKAALPPT